MRIESSGTVANGWEIDNDGHGHIRAFTQDYVHWNSHENGRVYTWTSDTYNYDANDTILLLRNDSTSLDLIITDIFLRSDTETDFDLHFTDETAFTPAGTTITGVNMNRLTSNVADATCIRNETGNTKGNIAFADRLTADLTRHIATRGAIVLGYYDVLAVDFITDGGEAYVTYAGYFEDKGKG